MISGVLRKNAMNLLKRLMQEPRNVRMPIMLAVTDNGSMALCLVGIASVGFQVWIGLLVYTVEFPRTTISSENYYRLIYSGEKTTWCSI